jgi:inhibitor of Bruton tyrosine kinase
MTLAHDYFNTRNLQQFQKLLDGAANDRKQHQSGAPGQPSTSGGKSWSRPSTLVSMTPAVDVNARDWLGRTALHLACAGVENIEYVRAMLKHPSINVNIPDTESHWTPLHRAMYHANLPVAYVSLLG